LALAALRALDRPGRPRRVLAGLASAGTDTYGIYLGHAAVLVGVFAGTQALGLTTARWFETPLLAAATWILSLALVRLTRRLGPRWLTFAVLGERSSEPSARLRPPQDISIVTTRFATNAPE
jgi:peptidoglycan/LPS O-acetylase OafA/YrhL